MLISTAIYLVAVEDIIKRQAAEISTINHAVMP